MTLADGDPLFRTLKHLHAGIDKDGVGPSMRDLMAVTFASSTSVVADRLRRLERMGFIRRAKDAGKTGQWRLTEAGLMELGAPLECPECRRPFDDEAAVFARVVAAHHPDGSVLISDVRLGTIAEQAGRMEDGERSASVASAYAGPDAAVRRRREERGR